MLQQTSKIFQNVQSRGFRPRSHTRDRSGLGELRRAWITAVTTTRD